MNPKDQERVSLYRRYLLEMADRSRSRPVRERIRRWVELVDAEQERENNESRARNSELRRAATRATLFTRGWASRT